MISTQITNSTFGSLLAVWLSFVFRDYFPPPDAVGNQMMFTEFFFIGMMALLLHFGFSRPRFWERLVLYSLLALFAWKGVQAISGLADLAFPQTYEESRIWFVVLVLGAWICFAELGTKANKVVGL